MEYRLIFESPDQAKDAAQWMITYPLMSTTPVAKRHENFIDFKTEGNVINIKKIPEHLPNFFLGLKNAGFFDISITPIYQPNRNGVLQQLWPSGLFSDVTLKVGDESFRVHRAILAVSSPYFKALFTYQPEPVIKLEELEPEIFRQVLNLIYGQKVEFDGLEGLKLLIYLQRFELSQVDPMNVIERMKVEEEDLGEFLSLIDQLYPMEYPYWFMKFFFEQITPDFSTPLEVILSGLPEIFRRYFEETHE